MQVRYSGTRIPKHPFLRLGLDLTLGKVGSCLEWQSRPPRTPFLALHMPKEVVAKSSYRITDLCASYRNRAQMCSSLMMAATKAKLGCKAWRHVFPSSSTSASLLAENPVLHSSSHLVILEEFCLPLCRSPNYFAYRAQNPFTSFLWAQALCFIRL